MTTRRAALHAAAAALALTACDGPRARGADMAGGPVPPLKSLAPCPVGSCVMTPQLSDPAFVALIRAHFNQITPEWEMKMERVLADDGTFRFDAADRIAGGDLSARAPVGAADDAFDHIAVALNAMLARIEALMTGMQSVTDSLAHDLRSPLTRLRAALSEALAPEADETRRLDLIETAHGECERVLATFGALLDIARAESGVSREMLAPLDAAATVAEVAELFAPVVEDAGQTLTVRTPPEPVTMSGHDLLLRQALGNLLHNAVRYAGAGARIELALEEDAESVRFVVADDGPGVPAEARDRVQERFVRLDASRSSPGSGLGLAIAAACAKLHDGRLTLEDNGPGLRATLIASRGSPPGGAFNKL